ncbi:putative phosphatidate phosphatase isoform X2 [Amblyomma americanum]
MLYAVCFAVPVVLIFVVEVVRILSRVPEPISGRGGSFFSWQVPATLQVLYGLLAPFLFGAAVTRLLTVVAKYGVGKLRPNFLTRCGYEVFTEFCSLDKPHNLYRSWFVCPTTTAVEQLVDMRLGFVSGHASLAAYAISYMVVYLQVRVPWRGSGATALRCALQVLLVTFAWYIGLSRVSDFEHFWVDVLVGFALGCLVAAFVLAYLSPMKNCAGAHPPAMLRGENGVQGAPYSAFPTAASAV